MAQQRLEIKMARFENSPWGFRLHGGADFATPLTIQKVRTKHILFKFIVSTVFLSSMIDFCNAH